MHKIIIFCSFLAIILSDPTCNDGEYLTEQSSTKVCTGCPANCTKCTGVNKCTECIETHFLYENGDKTICELNTSLTANCATSTDKEKCTKCLSGYFLNSTSNCVKSTFGAKCLEWETADTEKCKTPASGYFLDDGTPTACSSNCDTCDSATECTTCKSGYYLKEDNTCGEASLACKTWQKKNTEACATCEDGFSVIDNKCSNDQCSAPSCTDSHCAECADVDICTACETGYFVKNNACSECLTHCAACTTEGTCSACSDGYLLSSDKSECTACLADCKECSDAATCTECMDGFFLTSSNTCTECAENCKKCSDASTCTEAMEGYIVDSNAPVKCTVENCATCEPVATCKTCKDGYYLNNNKCVACAAGNFLDTQDPDNIQCVTCAQKVFKAYCSTSQWTKEFWDCQDLTDHCATNEVAPLTGAGEEEQRCASCEAGYYLKDDKTCTACTISNCDQCTKEKCLDCSDNYFLSDDLAECKACPSNCKRCNADDACLECATGYALNSTSLCDKSDSTDGGDSNNTNDEDGASIISLGSIFLLALLILW